MKYLKIISSVLFIVIALAWLQRSLHPQPLDDEAMPPYGVGQVLAEEAAKEMHEKGQVVIVCMPMSSVRGQAQMRGFLETLGQYKNITLTATNIFQPSETLIGCLSFPQFFGVVNANSKADVIVSFLGVTSFTESQIATLPNPCPKLVVMDWNPGDVQRGMKAGLLKAAVMSRRLTGLPSDHPKTPHQWFDRYYDLVTPEPSGNP